MFILIKIQMRARCSKWLWSFESLLIVRFHSDLFFLPTAIYLLKHCAFTYFPILTVWVWVTSSVCSNMFSCPLYSLPIGVRSRSLIKPKYMGFCNILISTKKKKNPTRIISVLGKNLTNSSRIWTIRCCIKHQKFRIYI